MSRSYRKNPICGITCAESEKWFKRVSSRRVRLAVREALRRGELILPDKRELCQLWWGPKDGKQRFDPDKHGGLMRK